MKARLRKLQRILKVQRQMQEIAELKLAHLEKRGAELDEAQVSLIRSLNEESPLHGLFVDMMARRLTRLTTESDRVNEMRAEQAERLLAQARRVRTTERLSGRVAREARRADEKIDFRALLEAFQQLDKASST